jgi:hypothetical protein
LYVTTSKYETKTSNKYDLHLASGICKSARGKGGTREWLGRTRPSECCSVPSLRSGFRGAPGSKTMPPGRYSLAVHSRVRATAPEPPTTAPATGRSHRPHQTGPVAVQGPGPVRRPRAAHGGGGVRGSGPRSRPPAIANTHTKTRIPKSRTTQVSTKLRATVHSISTTSRTQLQHRDSESRLQTPKRILVIDLGNS